MALNFNRRGKSNTSHPIFRYYLKEIFGINLGKRLFSTGGLRPLVTRKGKSRAIVVFTTATHDKDTPSFR